MNFQIKHLGGPALLFAAIGAFAVAACDNKMGPNVAASVTAVSGDSQHVLVGNRASAPLVIVVENSDHAPLANVPVRWGVPTGGGSIQPFYDTTAIQGQAQVIYFSGALVGKAKVTAVAGGQERDFTVFLDADTTGTISAYGGNGSAGLIGSQLTLTARATDRFGNPISGVVVNWSAASGALQNPSSTTDSTGKASNVITVGPDTGQVAILAASRFNAVTFTVSVLAPPPSQ
jgi:hypothetical protein